METLQCFLTSQFSITQLEISVTKVDSDHYLGVLLSQDLRSGHQDDHVLAKASRLLGLGASPPSDLD